MRVRLHLDQTVVTRAAPGAARQLDGNGTCSTIPYPGNRVGALQPLKHTRTCV